MSWVCPECGIENYDDSTTLCCCGYNEQGPDNQVWVEGDHCNDGFSKPVGVAVLVGSLIVISIIGFLYQWHNESRNSDTPLLAQELLEKITWGKTPLTEDFLYKSPDGFSLIIPSGYKYTEFTSGPYSLCAIRKVSNASISMSVFDFGYDLDDLVEKIPNKLKSTNDTYKFSPAFEIDVGANKCLRIDYTKRSKGTLVKGSCLYATSNKRLYLLQTLYQSKFESFDRQEIEKTINSLNIQ